MTDEIWPPQPINVEPDQNTSGTMGPVPPEIAHNRWNWGAFFLAWIWLAAHKMPGWALLGFCLLFVPVVNLGVIIALGVTGNHHGWQNRRFDSVQQFQEVQKRWANWGVVVFVISFVVALPFLLPMVAILQQLSSSPK